jgi:hypothetical protein
LKENNFSPRIYYPAKLSFKIDGGIKVFHNKPESKTIHDHQATFTKDSERTPAHRRRKQT